MQLFMGVEGVWETCTLSLSPLQALKSIPDPFEVLSIHDPWEIYTRSPLESPESESDSGSDDGSISPISSHYPTEQYLSGEMPVDWGATETFARLADNFLGLHFAPSQTHAGARAIATTTPQARSLRAPDYHQDVRSRGRPNQKCHALQRRAAPQSYATANKTLVGWCPQDTGLQDGVSNASNPKKSQKMCSPLQLKAHPYGRTKAGRNYGPDDWLSSGDPKERTDNDDALSTNAVYAEEFNQLSRAPLIRTVDLPDDKEMTKEQSEQLLFSGPDLGGWLTGTFDGVPKMIHLDHLDFAVPVPLGRSSPYSILSQANKGSV